MSDWEPKIVKIEKVEKHLKADALDIVRTSLGDYPIVSALGEWKVGDLAAYLPIDTIVPSTETFYFLCPRETETFIEGDQVKSRLGSPKYSWNEVPPRFRRIKAKKIRGEYSQGLLIASPDPSLKLGDSIVDILGLTKFQEEEEENIPSRSGKNYVQDDIQPTDWNVPYYDIDSVRKNLNYFLPNEEIVLLEKDHGSTAAFCFDGQKLWTKSRRHFKRAQIAIINETGDSIIVDSTDQWNVAAKFLDLKKKLSAFPMKVFFAECVGAIKGFRYDSKIINGVLQPTLHFFDVYDPITKTFLDYDESVEMIRAAGLTASYELYRGPWKGKEEMYPYAEGLSNWNASHVREGWVMKPVKERKINSSRWQVKLVGEGYNLNKR